MMMLIIMNEKLTLSLSIAEGGRLLGGDLESCLMKKNNNNKNTNSRNKSLIYI